MKVIGLSPETNKKREVFFRLIFGSETGFLCVAHRKGDRMYENFFHYPAELDQAVEHVNRFYSEADVYFCPQLLGAKKRIKESAQDCTALWADLDTCPPTSLLVEPSILIESSQGKWQALWLLDTPVPPEVAEDYSRRIAYRHADEGADKSGWDLTQLLRVPLTYNHKYEPRDVVAIPKASNTKYNIEAFSSYPQAHGYEYLDVPFPKDLPDTDPKAILEANRNVLNPRAWTLFYETPTTPKGEGGWSTNLWQLQLLLFESGLSREEVFILANASACNKYKRDKKDPRLLWKEVCRAEAHVRGLQLQLHAVVGPLHTKPILTDEERAWVEANPTYIEKYIDWAKTLGDAAWQYHQAGAFVTLSVLLSSHVRLPTSFGSVIPNLWFMILADTTLTRKTTAMDIAMDLVLEVDPDAILATDGSIEGLFQSLSSRPGRASVFLRDEFSGLLEAMTKKDYYAGMQETLTKMYDGKFQKRVLRREVIEVRDPILILFTGGIRTRIYELLRYEHVASGFIPRFLFISADSDITKLRPLGPPTTESMGVRDELVTYLTELQKHYTQEEEMKVGIGDKVRLIKRPKRWDAQLTPDAWVRYNRYEADLVALGLDSAQPELMTPTMDRLSKSGLKMATLLAASRQLSDHIYVEEQDIIRAFYYIERWREYTLSLLEAVGKTSSERVFERIVANITRVPGISRSQLMQNFHLNSKEATLIFETLIERGLVIQDKKGRAEYYSPAK